MIYNRIPIALGGLTKVKGQAINYQYDQKQILILSGLELPDYYTVDFCNDGDQQTKPMVGTAEGVEIPDEFLLTGRPVKAYLIVTGEDDGAVETRYEITLPVNQRPARTDITPTPAEQSTIDGLIEAMNQAVTDTEEAAEQAGQAVLHYPKVVNEYWYVWDVTEEDYVNTGYKATGSGTGISDAYLNADYTLTIEFTDGTSYTTPSIRGEPGPVGATPDFDIGTVTTGQPGTPASATITGTAAEPLLNLTIPKGDPGEVTQSEFDTAIGTINSALTSLSAVTEIIDTASGAIASFPDGSGLPMRSLVAEINPVQDLHGYDNPWPAGGGVNKANLAGATAQSSTAGLTTTIDIENEIITISGTFTGSGTTASFRSFNAPNIPTNLNYKAYEITSGDHLLYTGVRISENDVFAVDLKNLVPNTATNIQFRMVAYEGSTAPTAWTPYSNICPISGWTGVQGQRTGVNLFGGEKFKDAILAAVSNSTTGTDATGKYVTVAASAAANDKTILEMPFKENTQYTFIIKARKSNANSATNIAIDYTDGAIGYVSFPSGMSADTVYTFVVTTAVNKTVKSIYTIWGSGTTYFYYENTGLFEGVLTADDFAPYTGEPISVSFGRTVYGGSDEVVGGNGTSTMGMVDLGALNWSKVGGYFVVTGNDLPENFGFQSYAYTKAGNLICSAYKTVAWNTWSTNDYCIGLNDTYFGIKDTSKSDLTTAEFKTAMSGVQLCYELATPQSFTTDPVALDTLYGANNIWVDTGSVEVAYPADTKLYIDKKIAEALA